MFVLTLAYFKRDENYVELISSQYSEWLNEFREVEDKRLLWDLVKYSAAQIPLTKEIIKEINSVIFKFVWRGRDKVKRLSLVSDYRDGGLQNATHRIPY